jgi:hypothetical protein
VLNDLQQKRGKGKAHGAWQKPEGSLVDDAIETLDRVTEAIIHLAEFFNSFEKNRANS